LVGTTANILKTKQKFIVKTSITYCSMATKTAVLSRSRATEGPCNASHS